MNPPYDFSNNSLKNCIPIIIDCWKDELNRVEKFCMTNKKVFIGSQEAITDLKKRGVFNSEYLPISISSRYSLPEIPKKDIDVIIYGRNDEVVLKLFDKLFSKKIFML